MFCLIPACAEMSNDIAVTFGRNSELDGSQALRVTDRQWGTSHVRKPEGCVQLEISSPAPPDCISAILNLGRSCQGNAGIRQLFRQCGNPLVHVKVLTNVNGQRCEEVSPPCIRQWVSKSYGKVVTRGQAIVFLINTHPYLLLIQNGASGGSCGQSGDLV